MVDFDDQNDHIDANESSLHSSSSTKKSEGSIKSWMFQMASVSNFGLIKALRL